MFIVVYVARPMDSSPVPRSVASSCSGCRSRRDSLESNLIGEVARRRHMKRCFFWLSALALVLCTSALGQEVITFSDGSKCGMEGTAKRDNVKAVNGLKNRYTPPTD